MILLPKNIFLCLFAVFAACCSRGKDDAKLAFFSLKNKYLMPYTSVS